MDYIIIGGDGRFAHLARLLAKRGMDVATALREDVPDVPGAGALGDARNVIVNYPPKHSGDGMTFEELLFEAPGDARIFTCGPLHPKAGADDRIVDLWADGELTLRNARLTAEGAVASAMRASDAALEDMRALVIGWGRIGRALTEILVALGAGVTVASRSEANRNRAVERGADAVATERLAEALPGHGLVFNTAPSMVLDAAALRRAEPDALLIDLASLPYGIDLRAAWDMGLRAWREPGLPGRYCPESAARALLEAIDRHERGGVGRE